MISRSFRRSVVDGWILAFILGCSGCSGCSGCYRKLDVGRVHIEYSSDISENQAQRLGTYLQREMRGTDVRCRVELSNRRYLVRFPVRVGAENNADILVAFRSIGGQISKEVFDSAPVDIALCDQDFKILQTVYYQPARPPMPISVTFRKSIGGGSLVAQYQNTSDRFLLVNVQLQNATVGESKSIQLNLRPRGLQVHGWVEGWRYVSGETIQISHADYEDMRLTVP